jgi:uncharacterized protein (DUF302 family)
VRPFFGNGRKEYKVAESKWQKSNFKGGLIMSYYFTKELNSSMEAVITKVTEELKKEGFGILSDIDMRAKLKEKLNVEFRPYRILGACNPTFGFQALQAEDKIGTMLPCNVVVQEKTPGKVEVTAIDPVASMAAVNNPNLKTIMEQPRVMLKKIIDNL